MAEVYSELYLCNNSMISIHKDKFTPIIKGRDKMSKASFIVFEGLDGSGKGTQISMLTSRLESEGRNAFHNLRANSVFHRRAYKRRSRRTYRKEARQSLRRFSLRTGYHTVPRLKKCWTAEERLSATGTITPPSHSGNGHRP